MIAGTPAIQTQSAPEMIAGTPAIKPGAPMEPDSDMIAGTPAIQTRSTTDIIAGTPAIKPTATATEIKAGTPAIKTRSTLRGRRVRFTSEPDTDMIAGTPVIRTRPGQANNIPWPTAVRVRTAFPPAGAFQLASNCFLMTKEGWGDPDDDVDDEVPSSHNTPISARQASLCTLAGDVKHLMANTVTGRRLGQAMHHLFDLLRCDSIDARKEGRPMHRKPTPLQVPRKLGTTEENGDALPLPKHPDWNTKTDTGEHVLLPDYMMTTSAFPKPSSAQSLTNALQLHFDRPSAPYPITPVDEMDNPLCTWKGDLIKERQDGHDAHDRSSITISCGTEASESIYLVAATSGCMRARKQNAYSHLGSTTTGDRDHNGRGLRRSMDSHPCG